ncbi:MAG: hypothetical protein K2I12_01520 [Duncaniella sp.]|nr:hypothetical protein [Duncaniella sp.]
MNSLTRWWRSKGHGIHSPYAFRLITEALPERGRYYAYDEIEQLPDSRRLKLLFRLVCEFTPSTVYGFMISDNERAVMLMADSRIRFVDSLEEADLIVGILPVVLREGQAAVYPSTARAWTNFKRLLREGMTFSNGRTGVAVNRHGIPRQDYESRF